MMPYKRVIEMFQSFSCHYEHELAISIECVCATDCVQYVSHSIGDIRYKVVRKTYVCGMLSQQFFCCALFLMEFRQATKMRRLSITHSNVFLRHIIQIEHNISFSSLVSSVCIPIVVLQLNINIEPFSHLWAWRRELSRSETTNARTSP